MSTQFELDLDGTFPRNRDQQHWLRSADSKHLCGYTPQQLLDNGLEERAHEALYLLGNVVGRSCPGLSAAHLSWQNLELTLQAHRGAPIHPRNPKCTLCKEDGTRCDEDGEPFYCMCMYGDLPSWAQAS